MKSVIKVFRELEATSQLPPTTPQQHITPPTVLLPAALGMVPPELAAMAAMAGPACAGGVGVMMPPLSPSVTNNTAAMSPQASIQMCMAPALALSPFPRSPMLMDSTKVQDTDDGCSVSKPPTWPPPQSPYTALRMDGGSDPSSRSSTVHARIAPAVGSLDDDSTYGPLTSASSIEATRLSHSALESSLEVNPSANQSNAEEVTPSTTNTITTGCGSWRSSHSDTRLDKARCCSPISPCPHAQAHHEPRPACEASLTCGGAAASRVGCMDHHPPLFPAFSESVSAFFPLTSVKESTSASAAAPAISSRSASHEQVSSGRPSIAPKNAAPHQVLEKPQPTPQSPLSTTTDAVSATPRSKAPMGLALQENTMITILDTLSGADCTMSSTLFDAPTPPPLRSGSLPSQSTSTVDAKPNSVSNRRGSSTPAAAAAIAMATAVASRRRVPLPASSATTVPPPPPPPYMRLSYASTVNNAHGSPSSTCTSALSGDIAFVPIGMQPAIVSASDPPTSSSGVATAPPLPASDLGLSAASTVLSMSPVPTLAALDPPGQEFADARAPATSSLRPAYWAFPCAPTGSMTVILAAPEVSWHPLTSRVMTPPTSSAGAATSDSCSQNCIGDCGVRGAGTTFMDRCSSSASMETPRGVSPGTLTAVPASSVRLEPQRASGSRGAMWTSAGQTYRNVLVHGGRGSGSIAAVTASGSGYSLGLPLYSSQPQLLCTPVPLDDTESVCAICLEGRASKTHTTEINEASAPLQPPRAAEGGSSQKNDSAAAMISNTTTVADEGAEQGAVRGVKPGSCLLSLPCGHCYHQNCVQRWLIESQSCPTCRRDLTRDATLN
ncbi:putative Ring finger domain/RING-H2 zinc finger domain containing protein [Leishmania naiffi]|uniref:Ring finger domain/RING-H2 zinc finger domain containing protein n=1 Tax=Leishmania naiffi TaxID=5678 RepID=A0AAW3C489_9TRYP